MVFLYELPSSLKTRQEIMTMGTTTKLTYQAIEDNGGGLHLAVFDANDNCIYLHSGYEYSQGQLQEDIAAIKNGENPLKWDGNSETPQEHYSNICSYEYGWKIVADDEGVYYDTMGNAAHREFGDNE